MTKKKDKQAVGTVTLKASNRLVAIGDGSRLIGSPVVVEGEEADALFEASSTAASSLSTATLSASSLGLDNIATATEALQVTIHQHFHILGDVTINQPQSFAVTHQSITQIEQEIKNVTEALTAQGVPFFDCKEAYDRCMAGAAGKGAGHHCRLIYIACLGAKVPPLIRPFFGLD